MSQSGRVCAKGGLFLPRWLRRLLGKDRRNNGAQLDEDAIYRELGRFVVTFQILENELLQLASFALDPQHIGHGRRAAANLWFGQLVDRTRTSVGEFLDEQRVEEPEFRQGLNNLLTRCRELAHYRNRLVHSAFVFLESGEELFGIVRSYMTSEAEENEVELDQEMLREGSFEEAITEIAEVAFELGQCRLQLIHWYRPRMSSFE
jgi:hypothetical protein